MAVSIRGGSLIGGGWVGELSTGTKVGLFPTATGTNGDIVAYKNIDTTPVLLGSIQTHENIHGAGSTGLGHCSAALDSNDELHVISVCNNTNSVRDVSYSILSGIDGTPAWASWEAIVAGYANSPPNGYGCEIDVDTNDKPHAWWIDYPKDMGTVSPQIFYANKTGATWSSAEEITPGGGELFRSVSASIYASDNAVAMGVESIASRVWSGHRVSGTWSPGAWYNQGSHWANCTSVVVNGSQEYLFSQINQYLYEDTWQSFATTANQSSHHFAGYFSGARHVLHPVTTTQVDITYRAAAGDGLWDTYAAVYSGTSITGQILSWQFLNQHNTTSFDFLVADNGTIYYENYGGTTDNLTATGITANPTLGTPAIGQTHILTATGSTANPALGTPTVSEIVGLTAVGITATPITTPDLTDLVAWWELNEESGTRFDSHGSNDLTDNATVLFAAGKQGNAANFEYDASEYLSIADNADLSVGDIDFSFGFWIKFESWTAAHQYPIFKGLGNTKQYGVVLNNTTKRLQFQVWRSDGGLCFDVDATTFGGLSVDTWYFVFCYHDSTNNLGGISVNDGTIDTTPTTGVPFDAADAFTLGSIFDGTSSYVDGLMDEVAFYKRLLTPAEKTWLYNSGAGRAYSEVTAPTLGTIASLTAVDITANPVVGTPTIGQEHALTTVGITANPVVGTPTIGQEHALTAVGITANPVLAVPIVGPFLGVPDNYIGQQSGVAETDMVVTLPTHVEGDLLVIHIAQGGNGSTGFTNPSGQGWSDAVPFFQTSGASYKVIAKVAGASEPSDVTIVSDLSANWVSITYKISGAGLPESSATQTGSGTTITCPTRTPAGSDNLIIWSGFSDGNTKEHTMSGPIKIGNMGHFLGATASAFYEVWDSTSPTGTDVISTGASDDWGGATFVVPIAPQSADDLDAVGITTNPVVGVPTLVYTVDTLWDDFDDNSQDTAKWEKGGSDVSADDALVTVLEQNNRLEIQPRDATSGVHYNGYKSVSLFSLIDSAFFVEIAQLETAGGANTQLYLQSGAQDAKHSLRIEYDSNEIYLGYAGAGASDWVTQTWNGTTMRWWRIIYDSPSDNVLWQYSPDGLNWTTGRTVAASVLTTAGIDLLQLRASISAGSWTSMTTPLATYFDNVSHHPLVPRFEEYTNGPVNILPHGDPAEYDEILWGGQAPASIIKFNGLFFMYYVGADGYDTPLDTPTNRALCLATSPDGVNWTKYASNPVVTYTTGGSVEEGVGGAAVIVNGSTIHLYYSAIRDTGGGLVDLDIRYRSSTDGYSFGSDQLILTVPGDEYNTQTVIHDGTDYHLYITGPMGGGKGVVRRYSGSSPTSLAFQEITLNEIIGTAKGIDPNTLITTDDVVMVLDYRDSARKRYQIRTVDKTVPSDFGQWLFQWTIGVWGDTGAVTILYDDVNDVWFIYILDLTNGANAGDFVSYWLGTPNTPLTSVDISANPTLGIPTLTDVPPGSDNLDAVGITTNPVAGTPTIGQEHALDAVDITANPTLGIPTVTDVPPGSDNLDAVGITTNPVLGIPDIGQEHLLGAWSHTADPVVGTPFISAIVPLTATGITANPVLDAVSLTHQLDMAANSLLSAGVVFTNPVLTVPATDDLTAIDYTATIPTLGTPTMVTIGVLNAINITVLPVAGVSTLAPTLIGGGPPAEEGIEVYLLDPSLQVLRIIEDYYSLIWTERYSDVGEFELELPIDYVLDPNITFGNFLLIKASDTLMIIEDLKPETGETKTSLMVKGQSAESILSRRITVNPFNVIGNPYNTIYSLITEHITEPADTNRKISIFKTTFPTYPTGGNTFEGQFEIDTVQNIVQTICKTQGLGFKIRVENNELAFSVYDGVDRSYDQFLNEYVVFSDNFGNVISSSFYESEKGKTTMVLVSSDDITYDKLFVWKGSEPTDLARYETVLETTIERTMGVSQTPPEPTPEEPDPLTLPLLGVVGLVCLDAVSISAGPKIESYIAPDRLSNEEVLSILTTRGEEELEKYKAVGLFEGSFDIQGQFRYGVDFFMGDIVQCNIEGNNVKARIIELVRSYTTEGEKSYVALDFII